VFKIKTFIFTITINIFIFKAIYSYYMNTLDLCKEIQTAKDAAKAAGKLLD
jgi:hypothetical protein